MSAGAAASPGWSIARACLATRGTSGRSCAPCTSPSSPSYCRWSSASPPRSASIDALKAFDTIFVISNGGPGTASETLNILLYLQAFSFYDIGYASAIVVVFFVLILLVTLLMLHFRQRNQLA